MFVKWAKFAGGILGKSLNVYTDAERQKYARCIHNADLDVRLEEFSAGAVLMFILGAVLGLGVVTGVLLYLRISLIFPIIIVGGVLFGVMLFMIFRHAPKIAYDSVVRSIERNIVRYVPTLAAAVASGLSIEDAFQQGAKSKFDNLSDELHRMLRWSIIQNDIIEAMRKSKDNIDSDIYSRVLGTIMHIKAGGIEKHPDLPPNEQPAARSLLELRKEERDYFVQRCERFSGKVKPITTFINVLFTVFPILIIILSVITALQPQRPIMLPIAMIKILTCVMMPVMTFMLVYLLYSWEPR